MFRTKKIAILDDKNTGKTLKEVSMEKNTLASKRGDVLLMSTAISVIRETRRWRLERQECKHLSQLAMKRKALKQYSGY